MKSWILIYMGLASVVSLADRRSGADVVELSPVNLESVQPALAVDALVRRTDI